MARYMLDLESAVALLRRRDAVALKRLKQSRPSDVCISAVTHSDLRFGAVMSRKAQADEEAVELFLRYVAVVAYPAEAGAHYGEIRTSVELSGEMVEAHALLVAAHARCLGLVMVTPRVRELRGVPGLRGENWVGG